MEPDMLKCACNVHCSDSKKTLTHQQYLSYRKIWFRVRGGHLTPFEKRAKVVNSLGIFRATITAPENLIKN
jgi:hypothetical protein